LTIIYWCYAVGKKYLFNSHLQCNSVIPKESYWQSASKILLEEQWWLG